MTQAHSGIENSTMAFEETASKGRKNEKQGKVRTSSRWAQNRLWYTRSRIGESMVPRDFKLTL